MGSVFVTFSGGLSVFMLSTPPPPPPLNEKLLFVEEKAPLFPPPAPLPFALSAAGRVNTNGAVPAVGAVLAFLSPGFMGDAAAANGFDGVLVDDAAANGFAAVLFDGAAAANGFDGVLVDDAEANAPGAAAVGSQEKVVAV